MQQKIASPCLHHCGFERAGHSLKWSDCQVVAPDDDEDDDDNYDDYDVNDDGDDHADVRWSVPSGRSL